MRLLRNILFIFALVLVISCNQRTGKWLNEIPAEKPLVLVSIAPYKTIVEKIAGNTVQVQTVIPRKANPHAFEPSPKNVEYLKNAKIWFTMGEGFEKKLIHTIRDYNDEIVILDLRKNIDILGQNKKSITYDPCSCIGEESGDVHLWLSPTLMRYQAHHIGHTLQKIFPEHGTMYEENLKKLSNQLAELHEEIKENMYPLNRRKAIVVSHPAFGYFCQDYQCIQIPVESEGKDPSMKDIEKILEQAGENHAEVVIAIAQYNNRGARLIADQLKLPIVSFDPCAPDYIENLRKLSEIIGRKTQESN